MEFLAVQGLKISPDPLGLVIPDTGTLTISSTPSIKVKAGGNFVYSGTLTFTIALANATGYDPGTVATVNPGVIPATAIKTLAGGSPVLREGDEITVLMTGTISGTPTTFTQRWVITSAGQSKVRGN